MDIRGSVARLRMFPAACVLGAGLVLPATASAGIFGTEPIPISVGPNGEGANGPSGHAAISGDDRKARHVAFDSSATNLVEGDGNGASDVFVWSRPRGSAGLRLSQPARPAGGLVLASVSSGGVQGNGESSNPSLDGSMHDRPHCVAFQSTSSNLAPGDGDNVPDVFVRDLVRRHTVLASRGVGPAATDPSIDGGCDHVAFAAGGSVYVASMGGGRPRRLGPGGSPSFARDGSALVWERGGVMLRAGSRTVRVSGAGNRPSVSDLTAGKWGVAFQTGARLTGNDTNPGPDVYVRAVGDRGGVVHTDLISASRRGGRSLGGTSLTGGITTYGVPSGIITFATAKGGRETLYYRNNHTGHIDDLAHAAGSGLSIFDVATSARANFVAFSSTYAGFPFDGDGGEQDVFFKALVDGEAL
jgi:hypothetical protein